MSFNPRTHTGCDYPIQKEHYSTIYVSIHAPTRGATTDGLQPTLEAVFQSTHPHGVRLQYLAFSDQFVRFNPRTHTGCDSL